MTTLFLKLHNDDDDVEDDDVSDRLKMLRNNGGCGRLKTMTTKTMKVSVEYGLCGKTFRFSIEEFCLITGLECGHDPTLEVKEKRDGCGSFRSSMLNGEVRFNNKTLEAIFKSAFSDSDEDMVKLALLYFLETVLFGKDQKVFIGAHHVELLEDLDTFNKYPWGRKCYKTTLNSLQRDLWKMAEDYHITSKKTVSGKKRKRQAKKENDGIRQYALHGVPYAFQIWACEEIPTIGVQIANKSGALLHRIVNWITPGTPDATHVIKLLNRKNMQVLKKLKPTPLEREEEYVKSLFTAEHELEPPVVDGKAEEDIVGVNVAENDARFRDEQDRQENVEYKAKRVYCEAIHENKFKLDDLMKRMDGMDKKLDLIINLLGVRGQTPVKDRKSNDAMEMDGAQMNEKDEQMDEKEELELVGSNGEEKGVQVEDNCNTWMSIIMYEKPPPIIPKRHSKKAAALKSPYTDTQGIKPKKLPKFKPLPKLLQAELKKVEAWL
ncbi:hypothetical protein Ddye_014664 [Dipteronia dyeriana]|uniref:DUF1985 domain-containing protein n=1 Tax=Dipteronia dyeriana TaxID=168575 RepID=A0AAE0CLC8_9ROSI|nr:hypothetical protein Ddye_014664 [Dipteronia dyeriana]